MKRDEMVRAGGRERCQGRAVARAGAEAKEKKKREKDYTRWSG